MLFTRVSSVFWFLSLLDRRPFRSDARVVSGAGVARAKRMEQRTRGREYLRELRQSVLLLCGIFVLVHREILTELVFGVSMS